MFSLLKGLIISLISLAWLKGTHLGVGGHDSLARCLTSQAGLTPKGRNNGMSPPKGRSHSSGQKATAFPYRPSQLLYHSSNPQISNLKIT